MGQKDFTAVGSLFSDRLLVPFTLKASTLPGGTLSLSFESILFTLNPTLIGISCTLDRCSLPLPLCPFTFPIDPGLFQFNTTLIAVTLLLPALTFLLLAILHTGLSDLLLSRQPAGLLALLVILLAIFPAMVLRKSHKARCHE